MLTQKTDIVILGAGIGGYETFRTLAKFLKRTGITKQILIIDQNNYFTFTPMLHEVASGSIEPQHATIPLRELIYKTPHQFLKACVEKIDPEKKIIITSQGEISYEYCVVGLGSGVNYFNTKGADEFCYSVRTLTKAIKLHEDIFRALENPAQEEIVFTIIGGGFTGVEIAGQFMHLVSRDLKKLYPTKKFQINLVEAGPTILKPLPEIVQKKVFNRLTKHGVKIMTNTTVQEIRKNEIQLADQKTLLTNFTVWSAGVKNYADLFLDPQFCEKGCIPTNEFLEHKQFPSLYAVGDIALSFNKGAERPQPQLGETAHREGQYVGKHLFNAIKNKPTKSFFFKSGGTLMPIGDWYGVAVIGKLIFFGRIAWWIRRTVYVLFMPGILRKLRIVLDWTLHAVGFRYIIAIEKDMSLGSKNI